MISWTSWFQIKQTCVLIKSCKKKPPTIISKVLSSWSRTEQESCDIEPIFWISSTFGSQLWFDHRMKDVSRWRSRRKSENKARKVFGSWTRSITNENGNKKNGQFRFWNRECKPLRVIYIYLVQPPDLQSRETVSQPTLQEPSRHDCVKPKRGSVFRKMKRGVDVSENPHRLHHHSHFAIPKFKVRNFFL